MSSAIRSRARIFILLALTLLDIVFIVTGAMENLTVLLTTALVGYGLFWGGREALQRSKIIWRLRNRLLVTYVFVGAVPFVLILALAACGMYIVVGQVATYLISAELTRRAVSLENPARVLTEAPAATRPEVMKQMGPILRDRFPGLDVMVSGDPHFQPPPAEWRIFSGLVRKDGEYDWIAVCRRAATEAIVTAPLTSDELGKAIPGLGVVQLGSQTAGRLPPAMNSLDFEVIWFNRIDVADWNHPNQIQTATLSVNTRPSAVLAVVFADRNDAAQFATILFIAIAFLLAIVELGSVVIGITMTRTITGAVHNLYEGTQRIGRGDFSHRIPVKGRDQLAALGKSFNEMSAQLESLVKVTREKERLESELTIASEVQNQLFPRDAPPMRTIELIGACMPARSVSGDYYDYLLLPNGNLAIAIGDVAGKGISAALLMASIQSIMRTQLAQGVPVLMGAGAANGHTAQPVLDQHGGLAAEPPALRQYLAREVRHVLLRPL